VRLSLDRLGHLTTFDAYRQGAEERCQRLHAESKILAGFEAKCGGGEAKSCTSPARPEGWYRSIATDHALAPLRESVRPRDGTRSDRCPCAQCRRGVAKDPAGRRVLRRGCDAGDAANRESLPRGTRQGTAFRRRRTAWCCGSTPVTSPARTRAATGAG
jgi:hypothetical protein